VTPLQLTQVPAELGDYATDRLASALGASGLRVTTPSDLQVLLGIERQRQLLGCSEDSSCMVELAAALGVEFVVTGRLTRLGRRYELDLRVLRQVDGTVVARDSGSVDDEQRIGAMIEQSADRLTLLLSPPVPSRLSWRLWGPLAAGVVLAAVGAVAVGSSELEFASYLRPGARPALVPAAVDSTFDRLVLTRGLGIGGVALGAALIVTGIVWNASTPVTVSSLVASDGAAVSLGGRF
jgi:hypothetical protein